MITFKLFQAGVYLTEGDFNDPASARLAFMFQDASKTDQTYTLSATNYTNADLLGYFAYFPLSSERDWSSFSKQLRTAFEGQNQAQFGWFDDNAGTLSPLTLISVADQSSSPSLASPATFVFRNISLQMQGSAFIKISINFDDDANLFRFAYSGNLVSLLVAPPNQQASTFFPTQNQVSLPMDAPGNPNAGSLTSTFAFDVLNLASFEAGFMFFAPNQTNSLDALSYPFIRSVQGDDAKVAFTAFLSPPEQLSPERTYFQIMDDQVEAFYADNTGKLFQLSTANDADPAQNSRFVLANRPLRQTTDTSTYFLTPAGRFGLGMADAGERGRAFLLCGITGTEVLTVDLDTSETEDASVNALVMQPGFPAFQKVGGTIADPTFLSSENDNVTTSYVLFETGAGDYISQPQESPLYDQGTGSSTATASGLDVKLLNFLPLPTWTPAMGSAPPAPMTPYAGIPTLTDLTPYLKMESNAINPSRRQRYVDVNTKSGLNARALTDAALKFAMTPQGLLAGLDGDTWSTTQIATSESAERPGTTDILQFSQMGTEIRTALQQNQIFLVISTLTNPATQNPLFNFAGSEQTVNIAGWPFELSPEGVPASDGTPPIFIMKFFPGRTIKQLNDDMSLWGQPDTFNNTNGFSASQAQAYVQQQIQAACEAVYGEGNCPEGNPEGQPDKTSLYYNFYRIVTDPNFTGVLALNANMSLNNLPSAIRAVTGGMTKTVNGETVSNIDAFRVHHVGVEINDTDPGAATPELAQSSLFGLVDYEKPTESNGGSGVSLDVFYNFEVEYLRALFTNSELSSFSCKINLTINNLFDTPVKLDQEKTDNTLILATAAEEESNTIIITGSYQAHSSSTDSTNSGDGVYSFVAEGKFEFNFDEANPYLKTITLTKLQFTFDNETDVNSGADSNTTHIEAGFGIWGNMVFKELNVLDIFSFEKLTFADLGISVGFDLTIPAPPKSPTTDNLSLHFSPGNLRLDLGDSPTKKNKDSMLNLLPFKLKSFLYSEKADQTIESLSYFSLGSVPGLDSVSNTFNYALIFDFDLGSMGGLVGSLSAFKFSFVVGWLSGDDGGIAFGVQLPRFDGKLEIKIQGVLSIVIEEFKLEYAPQDNGDDLLVVMLHNSYMEILGTRIPPGTALFNFVLFVPTTDGGQDIGWFAAYDDEGGDATGSLNSGSSGRIASNRPAVINTDAGNDPNGGEDSSIFQLQYLGGGQRVGPNPASPPTTFKEFLDYMRTDFYEAIKDNKYGDVYHPDSKWLILSHFKILSILEVGFIFYDVTPFYSLVLNVDKLFNFEITYTKISDSVGLFYANFSLPDNLRTFQVGAASLTLPAIGVSVYTNGDFKVDVGFPAGDDWSRSFRVQAQAGLVPVTGSGGFYFAKLSSATFTEFVGNYPMILAFGLAVRLGVGKDFTAGPLKAGVSLTFFGIVEGAAGYNGTTGSEIFKRPDAVSLKGQLGVIGELYGSVDFVIVQASLNVRLQASIGAELLFEFDIPDSGSLLLYVEASVRVSLKVKINLGFFSVSVSFSYSASFRFEWQLIDSSSSNAQAAFLLANPRRRLCAYVADVLYDGIKQDQTWWFLPEGTVLYGGSTGAGSPWLVASIAAEFNPNPADTQALSELFPYESMTAQLTIWAVGQALQRTGGDYTVTQDEINGLNQCPDTLANWITYSLLTAQLSVFNVSLIVPAGDTPDEKSAGVLAMPPFLNIATDGRENDAGDKDDLNFQYASKNIVDDAYIQQVDAYFSQLFVNQTSARDTDIFLSAAEGVPLIQEIFLNYFRGVIRGSVNQILTVMQNDDIASDTIDKLILKTVQDGGFANLAGQMSSSFRGGSRLPYTDGLTVPDGSPSTANNAMYALLWQEFPVGSLGDAGTYTVNLTNPDTANDWLKPTVAWELTSTWLDPLQQTTAEEIIPTSTPQQLAFNNVGPQSFAYQNPITWDEGDGSVVQIRPLPSAQMTLARQTQGGISIKVQSRESGSAYLPDGSPLDPATFQWATRITLNLLQVPTGSGGSFFKDIFNIKGASDADEVLIEMILRALESGPNLVESMQILYQQEADGSGLFSKPVDPDQIFALRTNTTTVSAPPTSLNLSARQLEAVPEEVVGATIGETVDFLKIIQQVSITNATGYYLNYIDTDGNSLPSELFNGNPAPVTLLIVYKDDQQSNSQDNPATTQPFYNSIVLDQAEDHLVYYGETTDPALDIQYSAVAAGSVGVEVTRDDEVTLHTVSDQAGKRCGLQTSQRVDRLDLIRRLMASGLTNHDQIMSILADSGEGAAQLNALYSLIVYQVQKTDGFIQSNLSTGIQPQQDEDEVGGLRTYRAYVPLYNLADANQSGGDRPPNRYDAIGKPFEITISQTDTFGNLFPVTQAFDGTNYYFDPIVPLDQWNGVVSSFGYLDDNTPSAGAFHVFLAPSEAAFSGMDNNMRAAALQGWYTVQDQLGGPGVSMSVETNLALDTDGNHVVISLSSAQLSEVDAMVTALVNWLEIGGTFNVPSVDLSLTAQGSGALPSVFEMAVAFIIERDPALISPQLKDNDVITFTPAYHVQSPVAPTVGASLPDGNSSVSIDAFAANFVKAFPLLKVAVSTAGNNNDGNSAQSRAARNKEALRALGAPSDGNGDSRSTPQSIWAVQNALLDISIGSFENSGPFYLSPKPLDNLLNTGVVPLPDLPQSIRPSNWSSSRQFTDVDLDVFNSAFFNAVDDMLEPGAAATTFKTIQDAYTIIALGRASLAEEYSDNELDWLFASNNGRLPPFTGDAEQLAEAVKTFSQEMRAALRTAYAVDTLFQYKVKWNGALPADVGDTLELFGAVIPADGQPLENGYTLSPGRVPVTADTDSLMTLLFGLQDIQDVASVNLDLVYDLSHIQYFLEPANQTPEGEARPSVWLQLINPYTDLPHVGPEGDSTEIPLVFRQFPTPPTLIAQDGTSGNADGTLGSGDNPLVDAAAWHFDYQYQAQFTIHDELKTQISYNTNLSAAQSGNNANALAMAARTAVPVYSLFEALARFNATWEVLQPILTNTQSPQFGEAAGIFAGLVTEVVDNTTWNPDQNTLAALSLKQNVTDNYTVTDKTTNRNDERLITLTWSSTQGESSWQGATVAIEALDPTMQPYPNQIAGTVENGITDQYTPNPPLIDNWIIHQITMDKINVLSTENALAGVQIERNLIEMAIGGETYTSKNEFIYKTPLVRGTQPFTPIVDNSDPVNIADLPNQNISTGCPDVPPPSGLPCMCQRIYTLLFDLLSDPEQVNTLARAQALHALETNTERRLKLACGFRYPVVAAAGGTPGQDPVTPLFPVVFARTFLIDPTNEDQLNDLAGKLANEITSWAEDNQIIFGNQAAPTGGEFVFDITLFAQLSGLNTQLLRLRNLFLQLTDVSQT